MSKGLHVAGTHQAVQGAAALLLAVHVLAVQARQAAEAVEAGAGRAAAAVQPAPQRTCRRHVNEGAALDQAVGCDQRIAALAHEPLRHGTPGLDTWTAACSRGCCGRGHPCSVKLACDCVKDTPL